MVKWQRLKKMDIMSDIMADLNDYIDETGYSKTVTVEKAIRMYLDSKNPHPSNFERWVSLRFFTDIGQNVCKAFFCAQNVDIWYNIHVICKIRRKRVCE